MRLKKDTFCSYCQTKFAEVAWPRVCAACQQITYRNPTPAVVVIIPFEEGIMAVRRGNAPHVGELALPGGYMDWRQEPETWEQTAVRETWEEAQTVIDPTKLSLLGAKTSPFGSLVLVCKADRSGVRVEPFEPSEEATERVCLQDPFQLCFPIQVEFARPFLSFPMYL